MKKQISRQPKRNKFVVANKYQEKAVMIALGPAIAIFATFILIATFGIPFNKSNIMNYTQATVEKFMYQLSFLIIWVTILMSALSFAIVFILTNNLLGSIGMILRDMDQVIDGKSKKAITARPDDELANDLLKRINVLIASYVEKK